MSTYDQEGVDYWHHHGVQSSTIRYFNAFAVQLVMIASIVLNGGTLYVNHRYRTIDASLRGYFISMSVANLASPLLTYWMNIVASVEERWLFGHTGCTVYGVVQGYCAFVSITIVAVVSFERWQAMHVGRLTKTTSLRLLFVWLYPLPATLPPVFGWSRYVLTGLMNTCCFDFVHTDLATRSYIIFISIYGFVLPAIVICTCYGLIMRGIYSQAHEIRHRLSTRSDCLLSAYGNNYAIVKQRINDRKRWQQQLNSIRLMGAVAGAFLIAWTPYAVAAYVAQFGPKHTISPVMMTVFSVVAKTNTTVNPIIYMFSNTAFRRGVCQTWNDWRTQTSLQSSSELHTRTSRPRTIYKRRQTDRK